VYLLDDWAPRPDSAPRAVRALSLSDRIDCHCYLDLQDYEWARQWLWCHTYGSGSLDLETWTISRPDGIYARRSVPIPGRKTPSGRQAYGNLFLHREILVRACGEPPDRSWVGDHINGDTLDNRRINLRWASKSLNAKNTVRYRLGTDDALYSA
jgi:hypothetical protein